MAEYPKLCSNANIWIGVEITQSVFLTEEMALRLVFYTKATCCAQHLKIYSIKTSFS